MNYYLQAVKTWHEGDKKRKLFAYLCSMVDGKETAALAQDCRVSVDTIEQHRNAYALYYMMGGDASDPARKLWEHAPIHLWKKSAQAWKRYDLKPEQAHEYLAIAYNEGMTREALGALIDDAESTIPAWVRMTSRVIRIIGRLKDAYKGIDIPTPLQGRFHDALQEIEAVIIEIANQEAENE